MQVTVHVWQGAVPKFRDTQERSRGTETAKALEGLVRSRSLNQRVGHRECSGLGWAGVGPHSTEESRQELPSYKKPSGFSWGGDGGTSVGIRTLRVGEVAKESSEGRHSPPARHFSNSEERDSIFYSSLLHFLFYCHDKMH